MVEGEWLSCEDCTNSKALGSLLVDVLILLRGRPRVRDFTSGSNKNVLSGFDSSLIFFKSYSFLVWSNSLNRFWSNSNSNLQSNSIVDLERYSDSCQAWPNADVYIEGELVVPPKHM